jgi:ubiquinone/menaquinone biosynthesis C-methylase UbiE
MNNSRLTRPIYDQIAADFAAQTQQVSPGLSASAQAFVQALPPQARLLDLGCGPGRDLAFFAAHALRTFGLDLSRGMLSLAKHTTPSALMQADMLALPLPTHALDGIWCCAALLHLPRALAPQALNEMQRVLRPNGLLFLSVKQGQGEGMERDPANDWPARFYTRYTMEEMNNLLLQTDFAVLQQNYDETPRNRWLRFLAQAR